MKKQDENVGEIDHKNVPRKGKHICKGMWQLGFTFKMFSDIIRHWRMTIPVDCIFPARLRSEVKCDIFLNVPEKKLDHFQIQ